MGKQLVPALRMTILLTILTGLVYPGIITGLCQAIFPRQADGSLIVRHGKVVGSRLIGQNFSRPEYFWPRPSAAGNDGYDATASSGSNLGPTNKKLIDAVQARVADFRKNNPEYHGEIPIDMVTSSASGLDPDISPESAMAQEARVARARRARVEQIHELIDQHTEGRDLGFLGEPRVNVLELNLALDDQFPTRK
ncbi:MAG TPA: potassium-transporting ATPase subunit KdpC [Bryobacteraceae bacterium]|nr:potassium-transporting ATPase subunit KdpC [Bryobacteraceae bacterium]